MATEIERKFLLASDAWRKDIERSERFRQGYLNRPQADGGRASVRVRTGATGAWLNIKTAVPGMVREEFEYPIPPEDAEFMLGQLSTGAVIDKTRHWVRYGAHVWEIDEFAGPNAGLVVAEIELAAPDESFARPDWLGREVTDRPRYYNVALSEHPYRAWSAAERAGTER